MLSTNENERTGSIVCHHQSTLLGSSICLSEVIYGVTECQFGWHGYIAGQKAGSTTLGIQILRTYL